LPELVEGSYYGCPRHGSTSSPTAYQPLTNRSGNTSASSAQAIPGIFISGNRLKLFLWAPGWPLAASYWTLGLVKLNIV